MSKEKSEYIHPSPFERFIAGEVNLDDVNKHNPKKGGNNGSINKQGYSVLSPRIDGDTKDYFVMSDFDIAITSINVGESFHSLYPKK